MNTSLTNDDLQKISENTGYSISTVRAILAGRRSVNNRNRKILELAKKIIDIKQNAIDKIKSL